MWLADAGHTLFDALAQIVINTNVSLLNERCAPRGHRQQTICQRHQLTAALPGQGDSMHGHFSGLTECRDYILGFSRGADTQQNATRFAVSFHLPSETTV